MNKVIIPLEEYERLKDMADAFSYRHTIVRNGNETEYLTTDEVVASMVSELKRSEDSCITCNLELKDKYRAIDSLIDYRDELIERVESLSDHINKSNKSNAKRIMVISTVFWLVLLIINLIGRDQPELFSAIALIASCTFMVINIFKFREFK